jgi:hypothetical protein
MVIGKRQEVLMDKFKSGGAGTMLKSLKSRVAPARECPNNMESGWWLYWSIKLNGWVSIFRNHIYHENSFSFYPTKHSHHKSKSTL